MIKGPSSPIIFSPQGGIRTGFFNGFLRIAKKAKKRHKKALESVTDCYGRLQLRKNAKNPYFGLKIDRNQQKPLRNSHKSTQSDRNNRRIFFESLIVVKFSNMF